jgi:hypothetical protein
MAQNATGTDDQVANTSRYRGYIGRSNEHSERVILGDLPWRSPRLGQVNLAAPPGHDGVVIRASGAGEAKPPPKLIAVFKSLAGTMAKAPTLGVSAIP